MSVENPFKSYEDEVSALPLDMYQISGHGEVDPERYLRDKAQDKAIKELASEYDVLDRIWWIPEDERAKLISKALDSKELAVRIKAVKLIGEIPETERAYLVIKALDKKDDVLLQQEAVLMIKKVPEYERFALLRRVLNADNVYVQERAMWLIKHIHETERAVLIREALDVEGVEVQQWAARVIRDDKKYLSDTDQNALQTLLLKKIHEKLAMGDEKAVDLFSYVPEEVLSHLILKALNQQNVEVQKKAAERIGRVPKDEYAFLIREALNKEDVGVQSKALQGFLWHVSRNEIGPICALISEKIRCALDKRDVVNLNEVASMIFDLPKADRDAFRVSLLRKIYEVLQNKDIALQKIAASAFWAVPDTDKADLAAVLSKKINEALDSEDAKVQKEAIEMIKFLPEEDRAPLFSLAMDKGFDIISSPLYTKHPDYDTKTFQRGKFDKTGSGITLLGGSLKDKLIIRHITPKAFVAWQRIYEDYDLWKRCGFSYVPIEPIQSFSLNRSKGMVDVYSGVLDLNYASWYSISGGMFYHDLHEQMEKIRKILYNSRIEHGHDHLGNFVLRFFRDVNGKPDFTKIPRLYLIDFDQAESP